MRNAFYWVSKWVGVLGVLWLLTVDLHGATVTWDGGGGDKLWQTAANWSGDVLPGPSDDVVLAAEGGSTVSITNTLQTTLRSLQASNSLVQSGGSLRLTSGVSQFDGSLSLLGNPLVTIAGTGSVLTVQGSFSMSGGTLQAIAGGRVTFPSLTTYAKPSGCATVTWKADGAGSRFELPVLESLNGADCATLQIEALRGAEVNLPQLTTLIEGQILFLSDGSASLLSLPLLSSVAAQLRTLTFEARNLGRLDYPSFTGSPMAVVSRKSGGVLPVDRLTELKGFVIGGESTDFPLLTRIGNAGITVDSGATVSVSNLAVHTPGNTCETPVWLATGNGSRLRLPALTTLEGPDCGTHAIRALAGGVVEIPTLPAIKAGSVAILADGAGSRVELPNLEACLGTSRTVSFEARNFGEVQIPRLPGGEVVTVTLESGGILPVSQILQLKGFAVEAMTVAFPELVKLGNANVTVSGGGIASAPKLAAHTHPTACAGTTWLATGAGSQLNFSNLVSLTGAACGTLTVRAASGARVDMNGLGSLSEGALAFLSEGTNSLINLERLEEASTASRPVAFEARTAGILRMPLFRGGPTASVTIRSGGTLDASQMTLLKSMLVSATRLTMPGVTRLFSGNLIVEGAGELSFPNLVEHSHGTACGGSLWTADGPGSLLDLSHLTALAGPSCGSLAIQAQGGGKVAVGNLQRIVDGRLELLADGLNSLVDLSSLKQSDATSREVLFEARNQGTMLMPQMKGGGTVGLTIRSNGVVNASSLAWLGALTASQVSISLPGLTNLDSGSLEATQGSVIALPELRTYSKDRRCQADGWVARGTGSLIYLPNLVHMTGGDCLPLSVEADSGGRISLPGLTNIESGWVKISASGAASSVQLSLLGNFADAERRSSLIATNGGSLDLGTNALVTSGVQLSIGAGTLGLPPTQLGADQLVLHGRAWHSYRVDYYSTPPPASPPQLYARVPLLEDFQVIGSAAGRGIGFLAGEFVLDPAGVELTALPGTGVGKVVYGPPGNRYDLLAAASVGTPQPWPWFANVILTNSFSILPPEPLSVPQRYFRLQGPLSP